MIEFTQAELALIEEISTKKGKDGKKFSFKGISNHLAEIPEFIGKPSAHARDLGERISKSVTDEHDHRLKFTFAGIYPDGSKKLMNGNSIAYVLV